jgi:hypothetical protein
LGPFTGLERLLGFYGGICLIFSSEEVLDLLSKIKFLFYEFSLCEISLRSLPKKKSVQV